MNEISKQLKAARLNAQMTQAQLAEASGATQANVSNIESGKQCNLTTLRKLAEAMGCRLTVRIDRIG